MKIYIVEWRQDRNLKKIVATPDHEKSQKVALAFIDEMVKYPEVPQSVEQHETELLE